MNYDGIWGASILRIQKTPGMTKSFHILVKAITILSSKYVQILFSYKDMRMKSYTSELLTTYSIYKNSGGDDLQCFQQTLVIRPVLHLHTIRKEDTD